MKKSSFNNISLLLVLPLMSPLSCVNSENQSAAPKEEVSIEVIKTAPAVPASDLAESARKKELLDYALRLSNPDNAFTLNDEEQLEKFAKDAPSRFSQAALVIGQVRHVLAKAQPSELRDSSVNPDENNQELKVSSKVSLGSSLKKFNIDLIEALSSNIALKNPEAFKLALAAVDVSNDSEEYKSQIRDAVYSEANQWAQLLPDSKSLLPSQPKVLEQSLIEGDLQTSAEGANEGAPQLDSASLLEQARVLHEDGKDKEAVEVLSKIPAQDVNYAVSEKTSKDYSNLAVQSLRQSAAQAYQESVPASDSKVKFSYLKKAKELLETAIKDFPKDDQIGVVKENLAMIDKDLSQLTTAQNTGSTANDAGVKKL